MTPWIVIYPPDDKVYRKKIVGGRAYHLDCIINDVQHDYNVAGWNKCGYEFWGRDALIIQDHY